MTDPDWREVRISSGVIEKLINVLDEAGFQVSEFEVARSILDYVREVFREGWADLATTPGGARVYRFADDDLPYVAFYGRLEKTVVYDLAIVEEVIEVYHLVVIPFETALEDPDDPTPDR